MKTMLPRTMKKTLLLLSVLPLLTASLNPSRAEPPASVPAAAPVTGGVTGGKITLQPEPGLTQLDADTYHYDAGTVDPIRIPHWNCTFTLKNTTSRPITVTRLRGSCGCETLLLLKGGIAAPTTRLEPGEQAAIHLSVNLHGGQSGPVRKYVWVDGPAASSGQAVPLATLEVDILLERSVTFLPSSLQFGKVAAGAGASQSLTVSFDASLFPSSDPPRLTTPRTDVQVRPTGPLQRILESGKPRLRQTYQVTLSHEAHAGPISGELGFDLPPLPGSAAPTTRVTLLLSGEVAGALDVLPASVFFGSVPAGSPVTRSVVLSTASPASSPSFIVTTSAPWLHASLNPASSPAKQHILSITLTPQAPVGAVQGTVTVALGKADHLDIPIVAELTKPAK